MDGKRILQCGVVIRESLSGGRAIGRVEGMDILSDAWQRKPGQLLRVGRRWAMKIERDGQRVVH